MTTVLQLINAAGKTSTLVEDSFLVVGALSAALEQRFASESVEFPSLNVAFDPTCRAEAILSEEDIVMTVSHIVAAASQVRLTNSRCSHRIHMIYIDTSL